MLEWLLNSSGFSGPADAVSEPPRASLRLNHVELVTQAYANDPAIGFAQDIQVDEATARILQNRERLDEERARLVEDRARERVECQFGSFTYTVRTADSVRIVAYSGNDRVVEIPERIEGERVTALDSSLFFERSGIEAVILPDTVESLGHRVFEKCTDLKYVRLSAGLKQVGSGCFARCEHIEKIQINSPKVSAEAKLLSGASIGQIEFGPQVEQLDLGEIGVRNLESVSLDAANPYFSTDGLALFSADGTTLARLIVPCKSYTVPEGCIHIADKAFDSMRSLQHVDLPQTLRTIGKLAFAKTSISSIDFPQGLESIGEKAFFYCANLSEVVLPESLQILYGEAFSSSGVKHIAFPSPLAQLGARPFDKTPAQEKIAQGSITVYGSSSAEERARGLRIDKFGGIYIGDVFLELAGLVQNYIVEEGTRVIAEGACKWHRTLCFISIPEGVEVIGDDAFRGAKHLSMAELPHTLRSIGAHAFADTALKDLYIAASVTEIGENALLVQGENPMTAANPLERIDLDPANESFYIQNGLFCKRGGGADGGDSVLLYLGPENVVRIPDAVTQIDNLAFCGSINLEELYIHDHLKSICAAALSTKRAIGVLSLQFPEEVEGAREVRLIMPEYTSRYRSIMPLFETNDKQTRFNFDYYDTWVACSTDMAEFAPAAYARMKNPVRLCNRCREMYEGTFTRKSREICGYFAGKGDLDALLQLNAWGYLREEDVEAELADSLGKGAAQKTGCLLELRRRLGSSVGGIDFSL